MAVAISGVQPQAVNQQQFQQSEIEGELRKSLTTRLQHEAGHTDTPVSGESDAEIAAYVQGVMDTLQSNQGDSQSTVSTISSVFAKMGMSVSDKQIEAAINFLAEVKSGGAAQIPPSLLQSLPSPMDTMATEMIQLATIAKPTAADTAKLTAAIQSFGGELGQQENLGSGAFTPQVFLGNDNTIDIKNMNAMWAAVVVMLAAYHSMEDKVRIQSSLISFKTDAVNQLNSLDTATASLSAAMTNYATNATPPITPQSNATLSGMLNWAYTASGTSSPYTFTQAQLNAQASVNSYLQGMGETDWQGLDVNEYTTSSATTGPATSNPNTFSGALSDLQTTLAPLPASSTTDPSPSAATLDNAAGTISSLMNAGITSANGSLNNPIINLSNKALPLTGGTTATQANGNPDKTLEQLTNQTQASTAAKNAISTNDSQDNTNLDAAVTAGQAAMSVTQSCLGSWGSTLKSAASWQP
jgi:hypothetical protein